MVGENCSNCDHRDFAEEERHHDGQIKDVAVPREEDYGAHAEKISEVPEDVVEVREDVVEVPEDVVEVPEDVVELPEDVVECIIARMPYPSIFKARCLSKRWNLKFSQPSSSPSTESTSSCLKFLPPSSSVEPWPYSVSFQKQIALGSSQWPSYCPTYVSQDGIFTFDQGLGGWRNILSLSHFPVASSKWNNLTYCGSLIASPPTATMSSLW